MERRTDIIRPYFSVAHAPTNHQRHRNARRRALPLKSRRSFLCEAPEVSKKWHILGRMATILSYVPLVNRLVAQREADKGIDIPPVEVHSIETAPEKRPRTLKHLLRANHVNHSIIYHNLQFDNHMPHILCSAYWFGSQPSQLHHIYDVEAKELEPWKPSPSEMVQEDWRDYLGDKRYQRAYVDFFEDNLAMRFSYNWKRVVEEFMFEGEEPLVNGLIGGRM